jgi:membrane-associated protease RseP (regulator of RpoE activity)
MNLPGDVVPFRTAISRSFIVLATAILISTIAVADAEELLRQAREATGGDGWNQIPTVTYEAKETSSGMSGHARSLEDLKFGRIRREGDFGIVRVLDVWDTTHHWRQNMTGGVHALNSAFAQRVNVTDRWLAQRAWLRPDAGGARLGNVERRNESDVQYDVITVTPMDGQPIEIWFDVSTRFLARTVRIMPITIETTKFEDYRTISGVKLPFRIETKDDAGNVDLLEVSSYHVSAEVSQGAFDRPTIPDDTTVAGGKSIVPIEVDGYVIVDAMLNGKGPFSFIFDTGGHAILTPEAVKTLGLTAAGSGSSGGAGADRLDLQYTKVDRVDIGSVTLRKQSFFVIPLQYNTVDHVPHPPLAGILGLEILERLAVRLDYRANTMTFWPRQTYQHSGSGIAVDVTFSDDIPLVAASLNGIPGEFALDTGNGSSTLVQHIWAERNGLAAQMKRGIEMVSFGSGGESKNWANRIRDFELAGSAFHNVVGRYAEDKQGSFSSRTEAGNLGTDVLANFTLDFDYAHNRIWFQYVPGFTPPPFQRSGMSLYADDPKTLSIVNILSDGPAARAGLQKGDRIVSVDGKKTESIAKREITRMLTAKPGTIVPIVYNRNGKEFRTEIVLKELLP